jgi:hypothetical protein
MGWEEEGECLLLGFDVEKITIQLLEYNDEVYLEKGILIEGDGLCVIYADGYFDFVCTARSELEHILAARNLTIKELKEGRHCTQCESLMQRGFYFESDGTEYCSKDCLTKVISWKEYLKIHDGGNGDAYWMSWEDN